MKKSFKYSVVQIALILIIFVGIRFGTYALSNFVLNKNNNQNATIISVPNELTKSSKIESKSNKIVHFAFVDGNKTFRSNVNLTNFNDGSITSIVALDEYLELTAKLLSDFKINTKTESYKQFEQISETVKNPTIVGLMPILKIEPQVKILSFNNISAFDKDTFLNYELKISSNNPNIEEYNPALITKLGHTGSMVAARWVEKFTTQIHKGDYTPWFSSTKPIFAKQDVTSSTWEAAMLGKGIPCGKCMSFVTSEDFNKAVKQSEIDVFSLASNHIMDAGNEGLNRTKELLESNNQKHLGASDKNNFEALAPILVTTDNLKIAYVAFNDTPGYEQWAQENSGGAANISDWIIQNGQTESITINKERLKQTVDRAKQLKPDLIVAIAHWSMVEYVSKPTAYVRELKNALIEEGVDVIFGDQTHWVGEVEIAKSDEKAKGNKIDDVPVFYSVGNYIFDQEWSVETEQGMSVEVIVYKNNIIGTKLYPHQLRLQDKATVELLDTNSAEYKQTLKRVYDASPNF